MRHGLWGVVAVTLLAGCGGADRPRHATLRVEPRSALVDRPLRVSVGGLAAGGTATLRASWRGYDGVVWSSATPVHAREDGTAVVDSARWIGAMRPPRPSYFFPPPTHPTVVRLALSAGGDVVARATATRSVRTPSVRVRSLSVARDGLYGRFYATGRATRRPALVVLGGSDGGVPDLIAELLASHGYPSLALAYFGAPGLPRRLERVPLEYFARGLRWLRGQPGVDPRRTVVYGISRGAEAALLVASTFPRLAHGAIAMVPSYEVIGTQYGDAPAWTRRGRGLTAYRIIPVERITGPVLTAGAGEDAVWNSAGSVRQIELRLREHHFRFAHPHLVFAHAGHDVGTSIPNLPTSIDRDHWGGSRGPTAAARVALWRAVLDVLAA